MSDLETCLAPAPGIVCAPREIFDLAREVVRGSARDVEAGVRLFTYVRETIRYNPYVPFWEIGHYEAPRVLKLGKGFCIMKSALLAALARSLGIPARLGFADIRNHILPEGMAAYMGTDVMSYHCFTELFLAGKWVKATPSFEKKLCAERGWEVVEFDGRTDALLPEKDLSGRTHVTYLRAHGSRNEVPLAEILAAWRTTYGPDRVEGWIRAMKDQAA